MKKTAEEIGFNIFALIVITIFAALCILPILYTISGSFTPEQDLAMGLKLIPERFTLDAYRLVLKDPTAMLRAYGVTIRLVIFGTALGLFLTTMTAYVLYRRDFKARNALSFFLFFTTLFSGGLVPHYILYCELGLRNTFLALMLGGLLSVMNVIIVRSYFTANIPQELVESGKIDGVNDFKIYTKIILPSSGPILATIGLLTALLYWNDWATAMIYISDSKLYPLQYYLYRIFQNAELKQKMEAAGASTSAMTTPKESYKLAMTVFTMGPVILFYPFVQKYFVAGVTVGAVKG